MISIAPLKTDCDSFTPDIQAVSDLYFRGTSRGPSVFDGNGQSRIGQELFGGRDEWAAYRNWNSVAINCYATIVSSVRPQVCRIARRKLKAKVKQRQRWSVEQKLHYEKLYSQSVGEAAIENIETVPDHPLAMLLDKVNNEHNWEMHAELTWKSLRVTGEAYWLMPANGVGIDGSTLPGAISYVPKKWVQPLMSGGQLSGWSVRSPNSYDSIEVGPDEILRIYYPDPEHPGRALSPSRLAEGFIVGSEAVTAMSNNRFERGGDSAVMLVPEDGLDLKTDEVQKLMHRLKERASLANTGLPMVLPPKLKPHNIGQSNSELQLIDRDEQLMRSVFAGHQVSPIIAGITKDLNRATSQAAMEATCNLTFNPALRFMAGVLTERLASRYEEGLFIWFDPINTNTIENVINRINVRAANAAITPSQVSVALGGEPIAAPEANVPYMSAGMSPLYRTKDMPEPAIAADQHGQGWLGDDDDEEQSE